MNRSSDTKKSPGKVRKLSARQLKKLEYIEAEKRTLEICRCFLLKLPFPPPLKKKEPELKVEEEQPPDDLMSRPDIIEFFGKKHKQYSFNSVPKQAPVASTDKSNSMVEKKSSVLNHTIKVNPSKARAGLGSKIQKPGQQSLTIKMHGEKQDLVDSMSEQTPETFTYKQKSKVDEKISTSDTSVKKFQFKETVELESKEPLIKMPPCQDKLLVTLPASKGKQEVSSVLKLSSEAPMCKPKSKIKEKASTCDQSIKNFPITKKTEHDLKIVKHPQIQTQASKVPDEKWKQNIPCINNYASVKTSESERQASIEKVPKVSGKKRKRERFDNNAVLGETPEAARKRLAIVLLRIAGKL